MEPSLAGGELVGVGRQRLTIVLEAGRAGRMVGAIAEGQDAEDNQGGDLNNVDGDVDGRRCAGALGGDPGHEEREDDRDECHEERPGVGAAHEVGIEEADHVADEDAGDGHHHAGIDPVVEVRAPADDELGDAGILEGLVLGEHGLLSVVVAGAGAGIELGDLGVGDGGRQAEQQRGEDADPHGGRGGWLAGNTRGGLDEEREPEEGAGGDERHCVAGQPG